ncbi:MAG: alginate O-acetyltransferase complex protein AlgI [Flavobacteriales bacterium]|jgi:D-alanyl-lipoteichoic acid acyltransferase DltB (MBOAT superfamily)
MLFNSIDFAFFLPLVFALYWFVFNKNLKRQNLLLLVSSYVFYGWWDARFLILIVFSTLIDFCIGLSLEKVKKDRHRKYLLATSIVMNLGFLGVFKYYNFFIDNFSSAFTLLGGSISDYSLNIILPVGISFYTFQTLSYSIDLYRKKIKATHDILEFGAFVSFFPQLVAGPIERASNLLPQFAKSRTFDKEKAIDGLRQILWGLFKKIVVADNCARFANEIFNNLDDASGSTVLLGALLFTFQIYGDFSGYSDIAIGTSRLFGINLMQNFKFPYFSRDIGEFWRRWHISLSTWFRDYLYIPLGGSKGGTWMKVRNTFIIFLVSGFWHGANWTFVFWGFLNALYFLPLLLTNKNRRYTDVVAQNRRLPSFHEILSMGATFLLTVVAWIFFRANTIGEAFYGIKKMFSSSMLSVPPQLQDKSLYVLCICITFLLLIEWSGRRDKHGLESFGLKKPRILRLSFYYGIILLIFWFGGEEQQFIYFQF